MQCSQHLPLGLWQQETAGYRFSLMISTQLGEIQMRSYAASLRGWAAHQAFRGCNSALFHCSPCIRVHRRLLCMPMMFAYDKGLLRAMLDAR